MPIVGITVNERGISLQRLAVTTTVAIGEIIRNGMRHAVRAGGGQ